MTLYVKKPIPVEATQWFKNGDHPEDYVETLTDYDDGGLISPEYRREHGWEGDVVRYYRDPDDDENRKCEHCGNIMHIHGWIDTLEGGHIVCPGDYIITGVRGETYPCKPDIFVGTYEEYDEAKQG